MEHVFEFGDTVLSDIYVGVVTSNKGGRLTCSCSDGSVREFDVGDCALVADYRTTLLQYKEVLMSVTR